MTFQTFLDGLTELLEINYRSRAKFDPAKFRVALLNDTDAMTVNATHMAVLKKEVLHSDGYARGTWAPSGAPVKDTVNGKVDTPLVIVTLTKPGSPNTPLQYDCVALIADGTTVSNRLISSISSNAFQVTGHGLVAGDRVFFDGASSYPSGITADTYYWVVGTDLTANQFRVAATSGGSALTVGGSFSGALTVRSANGVALHFEKIPVDGFGNNTRVLQPGANLTIAVQFGGK